jgi:hypothetical protein
MRSFEGGSPKPTNSGNEKAGSDPGSDPKFGLITSVCSVRMRLPALKAGYSLLHRINREAAILTGTLGGFQGSHEISSEREHNETL